MRYAIGGLILYLIFLLILWRICFVVKRRDKSAFFLQWSEDARNRYKVQK